MYHWIIYYQGPFTTLGWERRGKAEAKFVLSVPVRSSLHYFNKTKRLSSYHHHHQVCDPGRSFFANSWEDVKEKSNIIPMFYMSINLKLQLCCTTGACNNFVWHRDHKHLYNPWFDIIFYLIFFSFGRLVWLVGMLRTELALLYYEGYYVIGNR